MIGITIGPYRILEKLGEGGMGEVYRARDAKLKREVALKVLPPDVAGDRARLARFQREAELLASLNHSNIAQIYGFEESTAGPAGSGTAALVMELVEGEDLAARIARGPIPLEEAVPIATQIAHALEAAHERGVIHRDLKPANIKVRPDGTVKVLDFGLAKAMDADSESPRAVADPATSPTLTSPQMTMQGMILGTAAYMAPEQAKGKALDKRADIWAFGCVLYEMISGRRAFDGDSVAGTIARLIERDVDWGALPASTPPHVITVIEGCLRKDRARRTHDIADARIQLEDGPASATPPALRALPSHRGRWTVAAVAAALIAGAALGWAARRSGAAPPAAIAQAQLDLLLPPGFELFTTSGTQLTISPDGSRIAFIAGGAGVRELFLRPLNLPDATPIVGAAAAVAAVFSPDGGSIGFLARDRSLKRLSLGDGLITNIEAAGDMNAAGFTAPSWGPDNTLVFGRSGLWRLPALGGTATQLTTVDGERGEVHTQGTILPTGVVLFTNWSGDGNAARIESIDGAGRRAVVLDHATTPVYAANGHLVFHRDGALLAAPFDLASARITGTPVMVMPANRLRTAGGMPLMALSTTGTLVYAPAETGLVTLVHVSRDGAVRRLAETPRPYTQPRVSPDGNRVVVEQAGDSLWVHDLSRDARTPLTPGRLPGINFPVWTTDGQRIVYRRFEEMWMVNAGGTGETARVPGSAPADVPVAVAPDNDTLVVLRTTMRTNGDLYALSLSGSRPARAIVATPGYDGGADFSPDGKWLVYASTDAGASQVYLTPYPALDRKWSISTRGGTQPRWARNGTEVFYRDGPRMMSVGVGMSGAGVAIAEPKVLFDRSFTSGAYVTIANYDVTPDGGFVMAEAVTGTPRLTVILNWADAVRQRVAEGQPRP